MGDYGDGFGSNNNNPVSHDVWCALCNEKFDNRDTMVCPRCHGEGLRTELVLTTGMVFWKDGLKWELVTFSSKGKPYLRSGKTRVQYQDWREICQWLLSK
jgi:hypothetical protein